MTSIISKIKKANLTGRGGAGFPTWLKWNMVKKAEGAEKYVICNASEGEPGIKKDLYILEHFPEKMIDGIKIALDFLSAKKGYIYINPDYYKKLDRKLRTIIGDPPIELFKKHHRAGYIGGEETSAINHIESKRIEPRLRPPYPPTCGLWNMPTLVNNVETFYAVSLIAAGEYNNKRFYTISGDCLKEEVCEYPENMTIEKILKETGNYPRHDTRGKPGFDFFVQVGGNASGEILNSKQLKRPVNGGSITVYSVIKHRPTDLMNRWIDFFTNESCGQCTPCREGTYRLKEILNDKNPDWQMFVALLDNLTDTAFCGLGCAVPVPLKSYIKNVLNKMPENKIKLPDVNKKTICEYLK